MAFRDWLPRRWRPAPGPGQTPVFVDDPSFDQAEIVRLLEEEMLEAAQNLEFERAAQLRDKINEMKGAPTIKSAAAFMPDPEEGHRKIWQPKSKGRPGKKTAK